MGRTLIALLIVLTHVSHLLAQPTSPASPMDPAPLPSSVTGSPLTGVNLIRFEPADLGLKRINEHYQLWAGKQFIKDLGTREREAMEAGRLVRDLGFTQFGTIPGASPAFEFWLSNDEAAKGGFAAKTIVNFNAKALALQRVGGAWVIRDDKQLLYNFGMQEDAAKQALTIIKKFGFNQFGVVGAPQPALTYLCIDPYPHAAPILQGTPDPKEIVSKIAEQGLMLPSVGYVGPRLPIEYRKLEAVRLQNEWVLTNDKEVMGRFGADPRLARDAQRILQDARITEVCPVGRCGLPIYLCSGQAPRIAGLGFNNVRFQPGQLKALQINNVWCIVEGTRVLFEFGDNRNDAELVLKVIQHFQFDQYLPIGDVNHGGIRFFVRSK
jgi:hypothetical protein